MAERGKLLSRLRDAERSMRNDRLPPRGVQRIADTIANELDRRRRPRRFGWIPMLTFVAGAALVLVYVAWGRGQGAPAPAGTANDAVPRVAVSGPDCEQTLGDGRELHGACEVVTQDPGMRIQTVASAQLRLRGRAVWVKDGTALFDVDPVRGEPVRVVTPAGEIVVVGTRFRVVVSGTSGQVDLYEGKLEFHAADGTVSPIVAGEQFAFGGGVAKGTGENAVVTDDEAEAEDEDEDEIEFVDDPPVERPPASAGRASKGRDSGAARRGEPSPADPARAGARAPAPSAASIIGEVQSLRRAGDFKRAAALLEDALARRWPPRTADVLSYELGRILARHVRDRARACAHWKRHLKRFSTTRYRRQVEASIARLACSD